MAFIQVDDSSRIVAASLAFHCGPNEIEVEVPEDFEIDNAHDWKYVNDEFTYDPIVLPEVKDECAELREQVEVLSANNDMLTECILEMSEIIYGDA